jgi:predicted nucleic acid-binding protein
MTYWDTSCVVKLYTAELDSAEWEDAAVLAGESLVSSALLRVELAYAFEQKEARGEILRGSTQALLRVFENDIAEGRYQLVPVGSDVLQTACKIAAECYHSQPVVSLRTLDGIHLATAILLKCKRIATADARMQAAAPLLGLDLAGSPQ